MAPLNSWTPIALLVALVAPAHAERPDVLRARLDQAKPDVVLIGNSMIKAGIDDAMLEQATGRRILRIYENGAMSAWQYLALKNVVGKATHVPKLVVVVTRENLLTFPNLRVVGKYKKQIDELREGIESTLDAVAYGPPPERFKGPAPTDRGGWDFSSAIGESLLPHMVRIAHEKGARLVVVQHKVSRTALGSMSYAADTLVQAKYQGDLAIWLAERGAVLLDYTPSPQLRISHYIKPGGNDHLNERGRQVWSRMMGDDLRAVLEGRPAPRQRTGRALSPK